MEHSEWASTTHIVTKKNGKLRVTGNYKSTLNPRIIIDEYPIPKAEHLFNQMKGTKLFCHLDITDAYTHLAVNAEFSHALTLNTPTHGLIRPARAVYGAVNIPAVWQRRLKAVLQDIPNVLNFFDDILVFANNFDNLISALDVVLHETKYYSNIGKHLTQLHVSHFHSYSWVEAYAHALTWYDLTRGRLREP